MTSELETFIALKHGGLTKAVFKFQRARLIGDYHKKFTKEEYDYLDEHFERILTEAYPDGYQI